MPYFQILDLTDVKCPAIICQRCLMDLERAISFRELVIRSDDHLRESCSSATNLILEKHLKEVRIESNIKLVDIRQPEESLEPTSSSHSLSKNSLTLPNVNNNLQSIVKLEQFELDCVTSEFSHEDSNYEQFTNPLDITQQNSDTISQRISKIRQKTTKMRPNPTDFNEESSNNFDQNSENSSEISNDNSDVYQHFDNFYQNLEDSFQTKDIISYIPNSINHEQNHISRQNPKKRRINPEYSDPNDLQCHVCSKTFSKRCYLTQHFQTIHMEFKPHRCKKCGKKYANLEELKLHEEKHVADKPFKCPCCPKSFIHKSDLKRHEISHSVKKPFQCTMCPRGFVRNDHLLKHERVHQRKIVRGLKLKVKSVHNVNEVLGM